MGRSPGLARRRLARVIGPARSRPDESIFGAAAASTRMRTPARGKPALTPIGNSGYPEPMRATAGRSRLISPALFTGPAGVGKSWLACALGNMAAREGLTTLYVRAPRMFDALAASRADGSRLRQIERLGKAQLLIVDDFLLTPLSAQERGDFLEIVEERHGAAATIITSQCPVKDWHQNIGDPTLADAICDRLLHNAYKFELDCPSIRKEGLS